MKIEHMGKIPKREGEKDGWWIGRIHRCGTCHTKFRLEQGDPHGHDYQTFMPNRCPLCGNFVHLHSDYFWRMMDFLFWWSA